MVNELLLRIKHEIKQSSIVPLVIVFIILLLVIGISMITYTTTNHESVQESQQSFMSFINTLFVRETFENDGNRTDT